ncbi:hypothetical protein IQ07DRAFT_102494 [Pyrenochaeta sp. DS3sAY3a]|nr:hypothetical protein IQ07DRAFT_102494 [Pyrenochaeta sp. DS3sAY3a]
MTKHICEQPQYEHKGSLSPIPALRTSLLISFLLLLMHERDGVECRRRAPRKYCVRSGSRLTWCFTPLGCAAAAAASLQISCSGPSRIAVETTLPLCPPAQPKYIVLHHQRLRWYCGSACPAAVQAFLSSTDSGALLSQLARTSCTHPTPRPTPKRDIAAITACHPQRSPDCCLSPPLRAPAPCRPAAARCAAVASPRPLPKAPTDS